jgi:hypothetical protein
MERLSRELMDAINEADTIKTLTTTDEEGIPYTVFKDSMRAMDEDTLAYIELIEGSNTYKNMLRNHWSKKYVVIGILNKRLNINYQIKGIPYKYILEGPIWDEFLERIWKILPDSDPSGVWLIKVEHVKNQDYNIRREEEERRIINQRIWRRIRGPRP